MQNLLTKVTGERSVQIEVCSLLHFYYVPVSWPIISRSPFSNYFYGFEISVNSASLWYSHVKRNKLFWSYTSISKSLYPSVGAWTGCGCRPPPPWRWSRRRPEGEVAVPLKMKTPPPWRWSRRPLEGEVAAPLEVKPPPPLEGEVASPRMWSRRTLEGEVAVPLKVKSPSPWRWSCRPLKVKSPTLEGEVAAPWRWSRRPLEGEVAVPLKVRSPPPRRWSRRPLEGEVAVSSKVKSPSPWRRSRRLLEGEVAAPLKVKATPGRVGEGVGARTRRGWKPPPSWRWRRPLAAQGKGEGPDPDQMPRRATVVSAKAVAGLTSEMTCGKWAPKLAQALCRR